MTTKLKMLPVRASPALRALIDQAGPVNAATRALIILGAEAAGLDLAGMEREVAGLLTESLNPVVLEKCRRSLIQGGKTIETSAGNEIIQKQKAPASIPINASEDDPLLTIGVEV